MTEIRTFDRSRDVSKLIGCNTRNVGYRWNIYTEHLASLPSGANVLDFGAGSLRETFDLAERGCHVTSVDMNFAGMQSYLDDYDWTAVRHKPTLSGTIPQNSSFQLVTAFDVIEHLPNPQTEVEQLHRALSPDGFMLCTVPNRRSLFEIVTRAKGSKGLSAGEAHLQFRSPSEWRFFFESNGFEVVEHDMAIGPLVNTWYTVVVIGLKCPSLAPPLLMRVADLFDRVTKPVTRGLYGWNLFVLRKINLG